MLIKASSYILTSKKILILQKISEFLFFCGIILIFAFPLISESTFIKEAQLKNTPILSRDIDKDTFQQSYREYLSVLNGTNNITNTNKILQFCLNVLMGIEKKPYNYIYTKEILSPRGDKLKFIQINLIYDPNLSNKESMLRANIVFYTILKFYSDQNNISWLSEYLQFNYLTKELFYEHPFECYELLVNGQYNKRVSFGQQISGIVNIDLTEFDIDNFQKFSLRFSGINSEQIDMDYYKMIYDNFISTFANANNFVTYDNILSKKAKRNIKKLLKIPSFCFKKILDPNYYIKYILYAINNILSNFLMINNKFNTNHLLVTKSKNSILMKIISNNIIDNHKNISNIINNTTSKINQNQTKVEKSKDHTILFRYRYIVGVFELIIKGISRAEIDLFRGQYFYILLDPKVFVGYYYLFIPLFLVIRICLELILYINSHQNTFFFFLNFDKNDNSNKNKNKIINVGIIIGGLLILSLISGVLFLHIEYIIEVLHFESVYAYYLIIIFIMMIQMLGLIIFRLKEKEEIFINELLMFIIILNCWNFIFINIGIGLFLLITILPMEYLFLHLKQIKYNIIKIMILFILIFSILNERQLISSMVHNYLKYNNNIYVIISVTIFFLSLRLQLFILMIINNIFRGHKWDYNYDNNLCDKLKNE